MTYLLDLKTRADLMTLLSERSRLYHNFQHIQMMLRDLTSFIEGSKQELTKNQIDAIKLAIWFHHAVHDAYSKTNEEDSVELFASWFDSIEDKKCDEDEKELFANVVNMILTSKNPEKYDGTNLAMEVFLDLDQVILGKPMFMYKNYFQGISLELYNTTNKVFSARRTNFIEKISSKKTIYRTKFFRDKYEKTAKENLAVELAYHNEVLMVEAAKKTKSSSTEDELKTVLEKYGVSLLKKDDDKTFH